MKGLNKIALVAAIAAASTAQAELVAMDDAAMGVTTGQAGLTIDVNSATIDIGQVAYQDQGFLNFNDISITGAGGSTLDNIRIYVDVVDGTNVGGARALGSTYLAAAGFNTAAMGFDDTVAVGDGDLVVALRSQAGLVDFGLNIGSIDLAASGYSSQIGQTASVTTTTLLSDVSLNGLLGPIDLVIHNDGGPVAGRVSETMDINAYFNIGTAVTGGPGTLKFDFMNTSMKLAIHNSRGADTVLATAGPATGVSFAHVQMAIGASDKGLAVNLKDFSGDIDLTDIAMGAPGSPSIGNLYITDLSISAEMEIYGH